MAKYSLFLGNAEPLIFSNFSVIRIFRQKLDRKRLKLDINYTLIRVIRWKKIRVISVIRTTLVMSNYTRN